ncbi:hypothetical protein M3I53_34200 [Paraburkholderia sp. CNPSo 3272]|uniref:hypothetical protein n=1 Tax=Paraburkholderia sp. CNPSo 3272 TaxID=2940931 RepID=UPI0020B7D745|nr:hypothetical protein [Paraburkholderia sp. CNPSo 3272]MCP3728107.1 hypothetical protein [Paraburkholderia sp. CNPSo 3272]
MFAPGVHVCAPRKVARTVALYGDSITNGYQSSDSKNRRCADVLAHRPAARTGTTLAVSNAGIAGNELLTNREQAMFGVAAAAYFSRDALLPNVRAIVPQEGINDVGIQATRGIRQ